MIVYKLTIGIFYTRYFHFVVHRGERIFQCGSHSLLDPHWNTLQKDQVAQTASSDSCASQTMSEPWIVKSIQSRVPYRENEIYDVKGLVISQLTFSNASA